MNEAQLQRLIANRDKLNARIGLVRQRVEKAERKADARRRYLAGEYFIRLMDGDLQRVGKELLDAGMLSERDKPLFFAPPEGAEE